MFGTFDTLPPMSTANRDYRTENGEPNLNTNLELGTKNEE
jgi:hypothetical protein